MFVWLQCPLSKREYRTTVYSDQKVVLNFHMIILTLTFLNNAMMLLMIF